LVDITLPEDAPRRRRSFVGDDYGDGFISLEEAETLAQATGQHRGTTVEFSDDGLAWVDAWVPTLDGDGEDAVMRTHPTHARAVVARKMSDGDLVKTPSVVRWDEYVPGLEDERRENWDRMPTTLIGKVAKVSAYRGAFRDVIGNRYEPAEFDQKPKPVAPKPTPPKAQASA
jgi:hypothetical protein